MSATTTVQDLAAARELLHHVSQWAGGTWLCSCGSQLDQWLNLEPRSFAVAVSPYGAWMALHPLEALTAAGWQPAADVWDAAIAEAREVINRRTGTYEADIDLLALPNPYRSEAGQ